MKFKLLPRERNFLLFSLFVLFVAIASFFIEPVRLIVHAFDRNFYSGYSLGKLILSLSWFFLLPLFSLAVLKLGLYKRIKRMERFALLLFVLFVFLGFFLGALQFKYFSQQYRGKWQFASFVTDGNYSDWEASKFYHNHFPKLTVRFIIESLGIDFHGQFDDGRPWFELFPQAELWASLFVVILLVVVFAGLIHLFSRIDSIKLFDFFIFSFSFLGFIIYMLDGGVAAGPFVLILFFFVLYLGRNYLRLPFNEALFALVVAPGILALSIGLLDYYLPTSVYQLAPLFVIAIAYYFYSVFKNKKPVFNFVNVALVILFLYSFSLWYGLLETYSFGRVLVDYRGEGLLDSADEGAAFFVYGLPRDLSEQELAAAVKEFGVPLEVKKTGWTGFVRFVPNRRVREKEIDSFFARRFSPKTYLYTVEGAPIRTISTIEVYWFSDVNSQKFIHSEFNDIRVLKRIERPETHSTVFVVEGRTGLAWRLLSVLTEARENGFEGKLLAAN